MAIKIGNLNRWRLLPTESVLEFPVEGGARLRVEFNTETDTRIEAISETGTTFIGTVKGNDTVEFSTDGPISIAALSEGEVWYHTGDGEAEVFDLQHLRDFKGIMQRAPRNPELERIMFTMQQNTLRVEAALAETKRALAEREAENGQVAVPNTSGTQQQETAPAKPATEPAKGDDAGTAAK